MLAAERGRIFEPFVRGRLETGGGAGLGLFIAARWRGPTAGASASMTLRRRRAVLDRARVDCGLNVSVQEARAP